MAIPEGLGGTGGVVGGVDYGGGYGHGTPVMKKTPNPTTVVRAPTLPGSHKKPKPVPGTKKGAPNSTNPQSPNAVEGAAGSAAAAAAATGAGATGGGGAAETAARYALINPPLHPKSETTFPYGHDAVSLQRGMIERIQSNAATGTSNVTLPANQRYKFRFLYNPESISVSTAVDPGLVPPEVSTMSGEVVGRFAGQETWRFGLMLDRTQEAYEQGIRTRGTQVDIDALYRVVNGNYGNPGFLYLSAVRVYWGPTTQHGKPLPSFSGYITSINITHTKFTPRMCPIRSIVDLSITRLTELGKDDPRAA